MQRRRQHDNPPPAKPRSNSPAHRDRNLALDQHPRGPVSFELKLLTHASEVSPHHCISSPSDVLSVYDVRIEARPRKRRCSGERQSGPDRRTARGAFRRMARPVPEPSYLLALVDATLPKSARIVTRSAAVRSHFRRTRQGEAAYAMARCEALDALVQETLDVNRSRRFNSSRVDFTWGVENKASNLHDKSVPMRDRDRPDFANIESSRARVFHIGKATESCRDWLHSAEGRADCSAT